MTRTQTEEYKQDRLGNINRALDEIRSLSGMEDGQGLKTIVSGETGTDVQLLEVPDDAQSIHINEIHAYNESDSAGWFIIKEADLDDQDNLINITKRSVRYNVAPAAARTVPYSGKEFSGDVVVVNSQFAGDIGVGTYTDRKEQYESGSEVVDVQD